MKNSKIKLKKEKAVSIEYKPSPMSPFYHLEKKLKKKDQIELAKLYNEKCFKLYQDIENLNTEIDNYKSIIADLQVELSKRQTPEKAILQNESKEVQKEVLIKKDSGLSENVVKEYEDQILILKNQIETLSLQNDSYSTQIKNLNEQLNQKKQNLARLDSLKQNKEKAKIKTDNELNQKLTEVLIENMFLMYLLDRSTNYEKAIRELNDNFEQYFTTFIEEGKNVNNIFSNIIHEFIYRIHKRADAKSLAELIFNKNCVTQSEDYQMRYTDSPFYTSNLIDDDMVIELNKKIYNYRNDSIQQIFQLIKKCQDCINSSPKLEKLKKFEINSLFSFNTSRHFRVNLNKLSKENVFFLISAIKYNENDIISIEFFGEVSYENEKCEELMKVIYQFVTNYKNKIKSVTFTRVTNLKEDFFKWISYLFQNLNVCTEIIISNCDINDEKLKLIKFKPFPFEYDIIDMNNNKISRLSLFSQVKTKQLILANNPLKFHEGDSKFNFIYLDLSNIDFSNDDLIDFATFMIGSPIQIINFSNIKIKDDNPLLFNTCLKVLQELKILYMNSCDIDDKKVKEVLNNIKGTHLLEAYFNNNPLGDEGCSFICEEFINDNKSLIKIELKGCKIGENGIKELIKVINEGSCIKAINIEDNQINKEECNKIIGELANKVKIVI